MKPQPLRFLLLLFLATAFLASCKEDDPEPAREELLTAQTWRGDKILVGSTDASTVPAIQPYLPDPKSISLTFNQDGTYTADYIQDGDDYETSGTWQFTEDEQKISGDFFGIASEAEIIALTDSNLNLKTTATLPGFPLPVPIEIRLVK